MDAYKGKSAEEIRLEDYAAGRTQAGAGGVTGRATTGGGLFGGVILAARGAHRRRGGASTTRVEPATLERSRTPRDGSAVPRSRDRRLRRR